MRFVLLLVALVAFLVVMATGFWPSTVHANAFGFLGLGLAAVAGSFLVPGEIAIPGRRVRQ
jgi:hypothetical protein